MVNKRKIINDPVFGFISLQSECIFDLIEHPYFQRLRRIKQLGLSYLVYPGANHTRFEHALGALALMRSAIDVLRQKDIDISKEEAEAVSQAILLHDIGHGPFSHAMEHTLVEGTCHEDFSLMLMDRLNKQFSGKLSMAIDIFQNRYHKKFLHQLVSSQVDMDRLDYLRRDSFYSGVVEGSIGSDRIIKMLNVCDDTLVVDMKGIYSIEKFLIARRLMYWQVYMHKTVISAERMLMRILKRAKELVMAGFDLFAPPKLQWFLSHEIPSDWQSNSEFSNELLENYIGIDDTDIISSIKVWCNHPDRILSFLANALMDRRLFKVIISEDEISEEKLHEERQKAMKRFGMNVEEIGYLVFTGAIANNAYLIGHDDILILQKNGTVQKIGQASDIELNVLSKTVTKHFICYPK